MSGFVPFGYVKLHEHLGHAVREMVGADVWGAAFPAGDQSAKAYFISPRQSRTNLASKKVKPHRPKGEKSYQSETKTAHNSSSVDAKKPASIKDLGEMMRKHRERMAPIKRVKTMAMERVSQAMFAGDLVGWVIHPDTGDLLRVPAGMWGTDQRHDIWDTGAAPLGPGGSARTWLPVLVESGHRARTHVNESDLPRLPRSQIDRAKLALKFIYPETDGRPPGAVINKDFTGKINDWLKKHPDWRDSKPISEPTARRAAGRAQT